MGDAVQERIERAKELLGMIRHAAMATVNQDGSPHNTPYAFMRDETLDNLYWASHPDSQHSQNIARSGRIFVVLFEAVERGGGLYIEADEAHIAEGEELEAALQAYNARRSAADAPPVRVDYFSGASPQRLYIAKPRRFWVNISERDSDGFITKDSRHEVTKEDLL